MKEGEILSRLRRRSGWEPEMIQVYGMDYFSLGIACPFLEDENCSIHDDRPTSCREYLVTSPAENCARPRAETIKHVPVPVQSFATLAGLESEGDEKTLPWVPLGLALEYAAEERVPPVERDGLEWINLFFSAAMTPVKDAESAASGGTE